MNEIQTMMDEDKEIWAPIQGYDGYEISTKGRVRSYWKKEFCSSGGHRGLKGSRQVKVNEPQKYYDHHIDRTGYFMVVISVNNKS